MRRVRGDVRQHDQHHTDFTDAGRISVDAYQPHTDQPSHFEFSLMPNNQEEDQTAIKAAWTDAEIEQVVRDYFAMRSLFLQGQPFVKAHYYKETAKRLGRSVASIEHKYMNISATLERLSLPWVSGYAPLRNFQNALLKAVETRVAQEWDDPIIPERTILSAADTPALTIEAPPPISKAPTSTHEELERIARRFDPALRDERNRKLGRAGEERVLESERARLTAHGRADLARKIVWVAQEQGDGAGYDILSFEPNGEERFLEVKTTVGHQRTPFYLSSNERDFAQEAPDRFRIFRLYGWGTEPRAFLITPPLESSLILNPTAYRASFG
ncbi:MAG: DUF3883 domain-containing protein [Comamonas sp.]